MIGGKLQAYITKNINYHCVVIGASIAILGVMRQLSIIILLFMASVCFAWDATGHRLIATLAYRQLTEHTRAMVDQLSVKMFPRRSSFMRFLMMSVWPDTLYAKGDKRFNHWHFIDLPYVADVGRYHTYYPYDNGVWAIRHCKTKLLATNTPTWLKSHYLAFLIHIVGDLHQPMHCINRFERRFAHGDAGGNLYLIHSRISNNLHHFWDQGGGLFHIYGAHYPLSMTHVEQVAMRLQVEYPKAHFFNALKDEKPYDWARESYQMAKHDAYRIPYTGSVSHSYQAMAKEDSGRRIVLAGLRLAQCLNQLFK